MKGVNQFEEIKPQSKCSFNSDDPRPPLEQVLEVNEVLNGDLGADVQQLTLNYIAIRRQCMSFKNVYRMLGKED